MGFFERIYQQIFGQDEHKEKPTPYRPGKRPYLTEPLRRNQEQQQFYYRWITEKSYLSTLHLVGQAYANQQSGQASDLEIRMLNMPAAKGFGIVYHPMIPIAEFRALTDFFRDKVKGLGYRQYVGDQQSFDEPNHVRTVDKYYLKPPIYEIIEGQPLDQQFGNILIECHLTNLTPSYIKVLATTYSDRLYTEPKPFDELVDLLFER